MVLFNYSTRELTAKIVFYGPGLCGKTTNLQYIYSSLPENVKKGKMLSLATKTDRTLFFDFLPIELGTIRGMRTRVQLYTVPGQVFYNSTRKLVLKGADGVVFVADSQAKMIEADIESYRNLEENLREMGIRIEEIPLVMQFNKRDLPNLSSIEEMNTRINKHNAPFYEAVAMTGIGVEDTLKAVTKLVLNNLSAKYRLEDGTGARVAAAPAEEATRPAEGNRRRKPAPLEMPPEDRALDALGGEESAEEFTLPSAPPPAVASPGRPAAPSQARAAEDDVIELVDEIDEETRPAQGGTGARPPGAPPRPPTPATVTMHPAALRSGPAMGAGAGHSPMTSRALATERDPLDIEDPIDLGDALDEPPAVSPDTDSVQLGPIRPGEEREVEVPVRIDLDGRKVLIQVRLKVRLTG
jgi:signal recognition particle receptor subunit beta